MLRGLKKRCANDLLKPADWLAEPVFALAKRIQTRQISNKKFEIILI